MLNREHSEHLRPTAPQSGFQTQLPLSSFWTVPVLTLLLQAHAALPRTCSPLEVLPVKSEEVVSSKSGMFSLNSPMVSVPPGFWNSPGMVLCARPALPHSSLEGEPWEHFHGCSGTTAGPQCMGVPPSQV